MDLTRTTDHIQSRPGFFNQNTAPPDLSKPIMHLSEFKGSAQPRGRANATDTLPPSLIARMTKGVLVTQRRRIANQPASSRDTRVAEHYKASYVLEDRGGATAPGAALSLRPTGKAAGGMDNQLRACLDDLKEEIQEAHQTYIDRMSQAETASSSLSREFYIGLANDARAEEVKLQSQYGTMLNNIRNDLREEIQVARQAHTDRTNQAETASSSLSREFYSALANDAQAEEVKLQSQYDAITRELGARSGR